jgi:mannose-6-phosphate isomerase-like protein (cupin superfamily)
VILGPGEDEHLPVGGSSALLKATGESTAGTLFVSETTIEPGFPGPPPHVHRRLHDMFYVLEGTLTFHLADGERQAPPGTFVCVPPGTVHTFSNSSAVPVRFLNLNTPAGFEEYMRDLAAAFSSGRTPTSEEIGGIASRHDVELPDGRPPRRFARPNLATPSAHSERHTRVRQR